MIDIRALASQYLFIYVLINGQKRHQLALNGSNSVRMLPRFLRSLKLTWNQW